MTILQVILYLFGSILLVSQNGFANPTPIRSDQKALICGVCKDIEPAAHNTIKNIEELGSRFSDYVVIIYENNSADKTATILANWAKTNPRVIFISETLPADKLPPTREEKIARARNIVLSIAKKPLYDDFKYLIMADLDFVTPWPINKIVKTTQMPGDWDCISANGVWNQGRLYWDRYAFRNTQYPFGPELIGPIWWEHLGQSWFQFTKQDKNLVPVFSAFGGLAVYKRASILHANYSGTITADLEEYYEQICLTLPNSNPHLQLYWQVNKIQNPLASRLPLTFQHSVCCEHLPFHASMALGGFGKIYVNPKMKMVYN